MFYIILYLFTYCSYQVIVQGDESPSKLTTWCWCFQLSQPNMEGGRRHCYSDEHYLPTLLHVSVSSGNDLLLQIISEVSHLPSFFLPWLHSISVFFIDDWSCWHCKLVYNTCWLVRRELAPQNIYGSRCYSWSPEEHCSIYPIPFSLVDFPGFKVKSFWF